MPSNITSAMQSCTLSSEQSLTQHLEKTLLKLKEDPSSITTEDARRLSENYDAHDTRSARIISAVEAFAVANFEVHDQNPSLGQEVHTSLLTLVKDLHAAVTLNPKGVTDEMLKTTQSVVGKMQEAVGNADAPNPESEAELQQEFAKVERKIEQGTVTKAEADHPHSLEARAHGHTEKGGITAIAQSVTAKRERQLLLGAATGPGSGCNRGDSKSSPGTSPKKVVREEGGNPLNNSLNVLGDRSNSSRQVFKKMSTESEVMEKEEDLGKNGDL